MADLSDFDQTVKAISGSEVAYLTVGLAYDFRVWRELWPKIMQNAIEACRRNQIKLVFFDNVYMYGKVDGWMTESMPYNPYSEKGKVRKQIAGMLMEADERGKIDASIARSADFYGPDCNNSGVNLLIVDKLLAGKKPQLMLSADTLHSLTYVEDAVRGTSLIGRSTDSWNQIWHLPTDRNALSGRQLIELASGYLNQKASFTILTSLQLKLIGVFVRQVKELVEMSYQNEFDYLFDSSKLEKAF